MHRRRALWLLGLILLTAFALRLCRLDFQDIWWDEARNIDVARRALSAIATSPELDIHPPLYYYLLHGWMWLVGESPFAVRLLSTAFGLLTLPVLYQLGRVMGGRLAGMLAAVVAALALLAVPLYWLMWALPGVGLLQGTLLFNMLVTATTALLVWRTALALGYGQWTGGAAALLYGLATSAGPYATHFFGEPLSALALLILFYALLRLRQTLRLRYAWAAGLASGLLIAGNAAHAVLLPLFLLYLWHACKASNCQQPEESTPCRRLVGGSSAAGSRLSDFQIGLRALAALPGASGRGGGAAGLLQLGPFRPSAAEGYHFEAGEGFNGPLVQGLWGLLS